MKTLQDLIEEGRELFVHLTWPNSQAIMDEDWYDDEATPDEENGCFIPVQRYLEFINN